jgi:hypothetical protein
VCGIILYVCTISIISRFKRRFLIEFFICTCGAVNIESEGPYEPGRIFLETIKVMREKISNIRRAAEMLRDEGKEAEGGEIFME